jgi:hypothetical protein
MKISDTETIMPDPILVGRNEIKLEELVKLFRITNQGETIELCSEEEIIKTRELKRSFCHGRCDTERRM